MSASTTCKKNNMVEALRQAKDVQIFGFRGVLGGYVNHPFRNPGNADGASAVAGSREGWRCAFGVCWYVVYR